MSYFIELHFAYPEKYNLVVILLFHIESFYFILFHIERLVLTFIKKECFVFANILKIITNIRNKEKENFIQKAKFLINRKYYTKSKISQNSITNTYL